MRVASLFVLALLFSSQGPQQTPAIDTQGPLLMRKALAALLSSATVPTDATLSGSVRRVAGSADETGTAVLKALLTGESRIDLTFSSGSVSEAKASATGNPSGSWLGSDAVAHSMPQHNLWTDSTWFFSGLHDQ